MATQENGTTIMTDSNRDKDNAVDDTANAHHDHEAWRDESAAVERLFEICMGESVVFHMDELSRLLQKYPNAARTVRPIEDLEIDYEGNSYQKLRSMYPLHVACRRNAPISVIRALLMAWPEVIKMQLEDRRLPLHEACLCAKSLETIQLLLKAWPESISARAERSYRDDTPLNMALQNSEVSIDIIQYLVEYWPGSLRDAHALHLACDHAVSLQVIQYLAKKWPNAVENWYSRKLPFHRCLKNDKSSFETISFLIDLRPYSVSSGDGVWCQLAKMQSFRSLTSDITSLLIEKWPYGLRKPDSSGRLALHHACHGAAPSAVIRLMTEAWPAAASHRDDDRRLPLYHVLTNPSYTDWTERLSIIQLLVEILPESFQMKGQNGCLLLHSCASMTFETFVYVLESYPQAVRVQDTSRRLPLHEACLQNACPAPGMIDRLVREWPESIQMACSCRQHLDPFNVKEEGYIRALPLDLACANHHCKSSPEIIGMLTNQMPPLHFICAHTCTPWEITLKAIQYLASVFPNDVMLFHQGMLPFHIACQVGAPRFVLEWWRQQHPSVVSMYTTDNHESALYCYLSSPASSMANGKSYYAALQFLVVSYPAALHSPN